MPFDAYKTHKSLIRGQGRPESAGPNAGVRRLSCGGQQNKCCRCWSVAEANRQGLISKLCVVAGADLCADWLAGPLHDFPFCVGCCYVLC
jgi:hypothetical protein